MKLSVVGSVALAILLLALIFNVPSWAAVSKRQWQDGCVLAADLSGHGSNPGTHSSKGGHRPDIWWTYCITTKKKSYTAVMRAGPSQAGLKVNSAVRFSVTKDRIYIRNSRGEEYIMRIRRLDEGKSCR